MKLFQGRTSSLHQSRHGRPLDRNSPPRDYQAHVPRQVQRPSLHQNRHLRRYRNRRWLIALSKNANTGLMISYFMERWHCRGFWWSCRRAPERHIRDGESGIRVQVQFKNFLSFSQTVLGKIIHRPAKLDKKLSRELKALADPTFDPYETISGKTMCTYDFYEGQGRLDGAFCEFSETEKMEYLEKLRDFGVVNIEMEGRKAKASTIVTYFHVLSFQRQFLLPSRIMPG